MTINWMNKPFNGPFSLNYWEPPNKPAIFAIMMKPEPQKSPTSFRILYFGKSFRLSDMRFYLKQKKLKCWTNYSQTTDNLYIAFFEMPKSSMDERENLLTKLINQYKPVCNF